MLEVLENRLLLAQAPFHGDPFQVDQIIQAEDFDLGGEGVAYHDVDAANQFGGYRAEGPDLQSTGDAGGGYNVGFIKAGEWLEYTVNIPTTNTYHIGFRVSNIRGGGTFHLSDANTGQNLTGSIAVPNTGNWQGYATVGRDLVLDAGVRTFRITFDSNASSGYTANFNWWSILENTRSPFPGPGPFNFNAGATLQAENFDTGGEGVAYHDVEAANLGGASYRSGEGVDLQTTGDAGGGLNVGFIKAGEFLEYTVFVPSAGTYNLGFRVANIANGGSFHLEDAQTGENLTGSIAVTNTGNWQSYTTINRNVTLSGGVHILRVRFDTNASSGYVANLNWLRVNSGPVQAAYPGPNPFVFAPGNKLELEHFDLGGEGVAYHDTEPQNLVPFFRPEEGVEHTLAGDTGGGYNVDLVKAGEWLEYTVDVPVGGTYNVGFRVANIRNGGSFHLEDRTSGVVNLTGSIAVPNTGDWQVYTTVTRAVTLDAGRHVLRLAFDSNSSAGWVGNFNWLNVS